MSAEKKPETILYRMERLLDLGRRQAQNPRLDRAAVKRWHLAFERPLLQIYEPDAELIRLFSNVSDGAVLMTDPRDGLEELVAFAQRVYNILAEEIMLQLRRPPPSPGALGLERIFVGHGRDPVWSRVVNHIQNDLGVGVEAFETAPRTSAHIVDILDDLLDRCDATVIIITADDLTAYGTARARQNVIHEAGLFQGRYGFGRVIVLQQEGTEDFSNVAGLQTIMFSRRVEEGFYDLDRAIKKLQQS